MSRICLFTLTLAVAGCGGSGATPAATGSVSVVDDNGREIALARAATRVVTLVPAATDILIAIGAHNVVLARTEEDSVHNVAALSSVGSVLDPSVERIVALQPDLVIAWAGADHVLQRLAKAGIPTYGARFERITDSASHTRRIGELVGLRARADSLADTITAELESIRARFAKTKQPGVFYVLEIDPLWTAGPNTFVDDIIQIAGGYNVFHDLHTQWSQVALEAVVRRQPDVIIVASPRTRVDSARWLRQPGWRNLRAVQTSRIHFINADQFNRPGPSVVASARQLARLLQPNQTD